MMNKKAIWLIIGLMGLALLGSVLLQLYWINWSVQLNREQFNNNVVAALNNIATGLERMEEEDMIPEDIYEQFSMPASFETIAFDVNAQRGAASEGYISKEELLEQLHQEECQCSACRAERRAEADATYKKVRLERMLRYTNNIALEERLPKLSVLYNFIKQELQDHGVPLNFRYGVFSYDKEGFVVKDNNFLINDFGGKSVPLQDEQLMNSNYRTQIYRNTASAPGYLAVYFPNLTSTIWKRAWKTMLAALVFTSIILFCFVYTVQVVFRQKKIGEMKTDFINNMTHEFKTPIATISLAADSITSPMISGNTDKVNRFADIIKQENKRMLSQVEKVLQMAQIDKENFKLNISELDLHELIEQAVRHTNLQVEQKGGLINTELHAQKSIMEGDVTHISNILHNLLDNANKYSPETPEITVRTRNFSNGIEVTVQDKGIGMSRDALKHIFDKFYRVHTGNLHDVKGFGLGLSYVKAIVTAHQGSVDVRSELGKGSNFILFLPFQQDS